MLGANGIARSYRSRSRRLLFVGNGSENSECLVASIVTEKWNFRYGHVPTRLRAIRPYASDRRLRGLTLH
ncbi:hypothetical protein CBM2589_B10042 [Cupriavidus taiwanensis]|uniref:Uncharacterized protein n=1 Tax=Cupriavidus taiwanensis TaxID=164546 RepID=A0A975WNG6_9BURK|nr:hypothetical protein CBM2589_B10042 [Cupriavidus taiwanensis]